MKVQHSSLLVAVVLAALAGGLILLSTLLGRQAPPPELPLSRSSPTWADMPTRAAPTSDAATDSILLPLQRALLKGDLEAAEVAWRDLEAASATDTGEAQRLGARLALMQEDLQGAESRGWHAVGQQPADPESWSLLGLILRRSGQDDLAGQAFGVAASLAPTLSDQLFDDRWRAALRSGNSGLLIDLAGTYGLIHPESRLEPYYRAQALLATEEPELAMRVLITALSQDPQGPALLWYTLGEAYLAQSAYQPAATAFEVAASKLAQGDDTLIVVTDQPLTELNLRLARVYLATDRCVEAEGIYTRLVAERPELQSWLERAVICQTPTPTLTPWIPKQIGTVTPRP